MKWYIIDGSGYLFRSYYGMPTLTNAEWQHVNAMYWFFKLLLKLLYDKPSHLAVVRDAPVKTIRREQFEEYKANRSPIPDEFREQIPRIKDLCKELGFCTFEQPWYEADDIIWQLALNTSLPVVIYTADKDMKQLISNRIQIYDPTKNIRRTHEKFVEEYGFPATSFVDYLALVWDVADNIPGIPGIWPKTAQKLICDRWSINWIYTNIHTIPKRKDKLITYRDQLMRAHHLMTLMECTIPQPLEQCRVVIKPKLFETLHTSFPSLHNHIQHLNTLYQQQSLF